MEECASEATGVTDNALSAAVSLQGAAALYGPCGDPKRIGGTGAIRRSPRH